MLDTSFLTESRPSPLVTSAVPAADDLWRSIYLFNLYRLLLASLSGFLVVTFGDALSLGSSNLPLFFRTSVCYVVLVLISQIAIKIRRPRFDLQLAFQIATDIVCLCAMSHASGGIPSGLGMLLLVSIAAAGLISRGKTTLFFAALASIAVLLQHSYEVLTQEASIAQYLQAGLLSVAYFVIAWVAHSLAKYATASEKLAAVRGIDLANMAEANRLVIQDMPDGVLVVDGLGIVRQCNPSAERLLGYTFNSTENIKLEEFSTLLAGQFALWRQSFGRKPEVFRLPGTHHRARVRFLPLQRNELWGAVVFLEDMQRVQAQARQIKLAALGRLTANIAHEVRNPLTSISYATELLQEGKHDPAQVRLFQIIQDNTARLNRIVQDVMQLNQRDRAKAELLFLKDLLPVFVAGLCQSERLTEEIVYFEVPEGCVINFDRGHLDQVLWNLCCNALRYCSKQKASVQLIVQQSRARRVMLEIADDGPGIDAEAAQQLFEPFFTTSTGGTGLGLYIARELCEANGAELEFAPLPTGGTRFRVTFGENNER
jgi:two-component system sensor histidine kinase PilS (NtrC family)